MYAKCGSLKEARILFEQMPSHGLVSWAAIIIGYALHGNDFEAIKLFWKMVSGGLQPHQVVVLSVLKACCRPGALVHGKLVHMEVVRNSFDTDIAVGTILVHMYATFGHIQDAQRLFNGMQSKNIAIWNAMVGGYAQYGDWKQAKECLAVLNACSHGGQAVAAAHQSLQSITKTDGRDSEVERYNCFVDVLGGTGSLKDARKMLCSMPVLPNVITWMSLLAACKTYRQTDLGRACFQQIIELDPNAAAGYTIMSNIYAEAQKWEDFSALQELQRCDGAWKLSGKAWIEVNNEVFEFVVDHPETYTLSLPMLRHMHVLAKAGGYVPYLDSTFQVSSWILK
ncbi:hypothetical protein L7F22_048452 [Adiantum nelumboides]|nr:hypothetical protein [Adiantum nelumboides]